MRILPVVTACTGVCVGYLYKNIKYERELQFQEYRHKALSTELSMVRGELDITKKKLSQQPQLQHALEEAEARETKRDERLLLASLCIVQGSWLMRAFMK